MADIANTTIRWGGTPEAALTNFEPVVQAGKTFKVGPMGGELYDVNRRAIQEEALGNQAIAKGQAEVNKARVEDTVLKNTMALLGPDATEYDMQSAKQYAALFGTVPIDPETKRVDKIAMHGTLEKYNQLKIATELAKAQQAGFKSEKVTKEIGGKVYEVMVHMNAAGQLVGQTVLGQKLKTISELNEASQKELSGLTSALSGLDKLESDYQALAGKIQGKIGKSATGTLFFPVAGKLMQFNIWDPDAQNFQAMSQSILSTLSRTLGMEVGNMSDQDIKRWAASVPKTYTPPQVAQSLIDSLRQRVRRFALDKLEIEQRAGTAVSPKAEQLFGVTPEQWANYVEGASQGKRGLQYLTGEKEVMPPERDAPAPAAPGSVYLKNGTLYKVDAQGTPQILDKSTEAATGAPAAAPAAPPPISAAPVQPSLGSRIGAAANVLKDPFSMAQAVFSGDYGQKVIQPALEVAASPPNPFAGFRPSAASVTPVAPVVASSPAIGAVGLIPPDTSLQGYRANLSNIPIQPYAQGLQDYLRNAGLQPPQSNVSQFLPY